MLSKKRVEKYSDVLLWGLKTARKAKFKKGDIIIVRYHLGALATAESIQAKLLDMGMNTVMRMVSTPAMEHNFYSKADNRQLVFIGPWEKKLYENLNGSIFLHAPDSLTHLADIDPKRIGKAAIAVKPLRDILRKREEKGVFGWTLCMHPTEALARKAGLTLRQYSNQVSKACFLDKPDPVQAWKDIYKSAVNIKKWLNAMPVKHYHVESHNIDLEMTPGEHRKWVGISGHNIPSFELFISPDWRGTRGRYYADQPSYRSGNYVEKVALTFKNGNVTNAKAVKGQDFLRKQIRMDPGAKRIGEFSLTDKRFSSINRFMANTLYDENFGGSSGNCHCALGASYSDTFAGDPSRLTKARKEKLGFNDSALHWDLVNTEKKRVTAILKDGTKKLIYENGEFRY